MLRSSCHVKKQKATARKGGLAHLLLLPLRLKRDRGYNMEEYSKCIYDFNACSDEAAYSGNSRPASTRMYRSLTPTSMQFIPISPRPPMGNTRSGGPSCGGGPGKGRLFCPDRVRADPRCSTPSLFLYALSFTGPEFQAKGVESRQAVERR